jgi:hypothetical protein
VREGTSVAVVDVANARVPFRVRFTALVSAYKVGLGIEPGRFLNVRYWTFEKLHLEIETRARTVHKGCIANTRPCVHVRHNDIGIEQEVNTEIEEFTFHPRDLGRV